MKLSNVRKILFITLSNIGDVILTLPVLCALKDNFPDAIIDVVVGPRPEQVFKKDPRVNRVFVYDKHARLKDKIAFVKKLKAEKYDMAVDMKTSLLPVLIGAKNRLGLFSGNQFLRPKGQRNDTERPLLIRALKAAVLWPRMYKSGIKHKRLVHLDSLRPFGIIYREQKNVYIDKDSRGTIEKILQDRGVRHADILIGVSPGSRSHLKQWRKEGFIDVISNVLKNPQYKVILIGDINEAGLSKEIANAVKHPSLVDLTGKTSLNELFALIEKFNLLLTCDSAGMHIASDLGVKVVAIFGPTDPSEYGPVGDKDIVIRKNLKCSPCKKAQCSIGTHECMSSISSEEVLAAVHKIL
ncbi:MAG: glycosyltransferase family 9 protein [Candidatus Omnitrophota bacterium]|nr:glycosyltransferase family 9 protein [Candidatus Omnitrophota bacterium]